MLNMSAPAKINLVLEVLGKREDGYHEIRSLIQTVSLCDVLTFELAEGIIYFECNDKELQTEDNLVIKAAELMLEVGGYRSGVKIFLEKQIPAGSGLGGGSSNAAATLLALNQLWNLKLKTENLVELAARLGSDVPFFIHMGMALVKGRGEHVIPLPATQPKWFVLLLPSLLAMPEKTRQLYDRLNEQCFTDGQFTNKAMESWSMSGEVRPSLMFNVFDTIAFDAFPGLEEYWKSFEQAGATDVHLAGSGPALFTPVDSEAAANELHQNLLHQGHTASFVSTIIT
jgi:4-diphosphocytidyl-2-C-methyl-D-erythritol kinase